MVALAEDSEITASRLAAAAADVDVVIDYLWGEPTATAMMTLLNARSDRSRALDWIQIGAMAGCHLGTAVSCAAAGQPPDPGYWSGGCFYRGLPGRAPEPR